MPTTLVTLESSPHTPCKPDVLTPGELFHINACMVEHQFSHRLDLRSISFHASHARA